MKAKETITFTDDHNRPTKLTSEELSWFHQIVNVCKAAAGCDVRIIAYDHELYRGKSKDALGCCCTDNPKNPLEGESYITIDCYFIDEMYKAEFEGGWNLTFTSLQEVIAHEIAHLYVWRHGKKHTKKTLELLDKIISAA